MRSITSSARFYLLPAQRLRRREVAAAVVALVAVSGYRVDELAVLAQQRLSTIAVCVVIWPVWAGQELHLLTVRNM